MKALLILLIPAWLFAPVNSSKKWIVHDYNQEPFLRWWAFQSRMEGLYSNHSKDNGGETMRGITIATYKRLTGKSRAKFLKMDANEAQKIAFTHFWKPIAKFQDERLNTLFVSAFWGGGGYQLVKDVQRMLNITVDGILGEMTILAANESGPELFHKLLRCRVRYLKGCWNYQEFKHGWQKSIDFMNEL